MDVQPHLLNLSAYINQNLEKDLPLSSLAKRVGLSPFHFHRKFGAYFGESLHQHIKRLRLERAAFALTHGSSPVRQIAKDSGYKTVSAFSHAFSGFAGESPTRYRGQTLTAEVGEPADTVMVPAWIGHLPAQDILFVRAMGHGRGAQPTIDAALALVTSRVGTMSAIGSDDGSSTPGDEFEYIAATSDVYGVSRNGDFRIDVGIDADLVPADKAATLGKQTLPAGRYARFDFTCGRDEVVDRCCSISLAKLRSSGESPRLAQYFVRFTPGGPSSDESAAQYRLFVPLMG